MSESGDEPLFPSREQVAAFHRRQIELFGGADAVIGKVQFARFLREHGVEV